MAGNDDQSDKFFKIDNSKDIQIGNRYFWNQVNSVIRQIDVNNSTINLQPSASGQPSNNHNPEEEILISLPEELINSQRAVIIDDFYAISDQLSSNWKKLARFLPPRNVFTEEELKQLERDNKDQLEETIIQMLQLWRERKSDLATVGNLAITLQSIGKANVANLLLP